VDFEHLCGYLGLMRMQFIFVIALALQIPAPPQPPASIEGIVIKLGSGEPLADAKVQLDLMDREERTSGPTRPLVSPPENFHRTARSDRNGRFIFQNVVPGDYRLIATRDGGYVPAEYGQRSPTGQGINFEIAAGQKMTGIQLALSPTGSITGRVYDRDGEPLGKAHVMALRPVYKNGERTLTIVQSVETDDRGEYRLFWLAPGRYYVSAKPDILELPINLARPAFTTPAVQITEPARFGTFEQTASPVIRTRRLKTGELVEETYVPVYYPGTLEVQSATPIAVPAGATVGGIDVSVGAGLMPTRHIRGRVINAATGQPVVKASVVAIPRSSTPYKITPASSTTADGLFDLAGVVPGSYQIAVTNREMSGIVPVEVGERDIPNLPIIISSGFKLSGRFVIEGARANNSQISFPRISELIRDPQGAGLPSGGPTFTPPAAADGSFVLEGVGPGDFRLNVGGVQPDSYVKSIRMGNTDVLNDGLHIYSAPENLLEVVIGSNAGRIEGSVVNSRQETLPNRTVVLVPDVRFRHRNDLYKVVSTDTAGRFRMRGVAPGNYRLFAWESVETGAWQDPEFIRASENGGRPIQISEGNNEDVRLVVIP
jgi:protocatechuate 3,4-dioxygenase beta subunit